MSIKTFIIVKTIKGTISTVRLARSAVKTGISVKDGVANLLDNLDFMSGPQLLVGIPGDEDGRIGGETGNAELGYSFEMGSAALNRPATPWLVPGVAAAMPKIIRVMRKAAKEALNNPQALEAGMNKAGLIAQATIKNRIVLQVGLPTPGGPPGKKYMIDTAQLLNSINYVIEK